MPRPVSFAVLGEQYACSGAWVVTVRGDLDLESLAAQRTQLERTAAAVPVLVLDLSAVTFADSSFLNLLLMVRRATDLRLAGVPGQIARLLELTGADEVLRLFPTVSDALPASAPAGP
ncbi:anti-anti-sigma factor [Streptomyces sp. V3I8]|uniref:STAS domain-containing protein n=1 Tax=Streptomyces sp. V3I8 TaxID=3042279 RepID=UPI002783578B|nr:STAS domain-containing protein [Streptomyces sp. V3I8]MDQ1041178.1 anti-anti-sigma factor [Streptomyces sp. V3I8]